MVAALAGRATRVLSRVLVVPAPAEDRAARVFEPSSTVVKEAQGATVLRPGGARKAAEQE